MVPQAGYDFEKIEISGFQRKLSFESLKKNVHTVKLVFSSSREAKKIISRFQPDLCIGTGGYVSGPVIRQAQKLSLIHIYMPLSGGKALVDAERVREIVDKIRSSLPQEIRQAKAIVSDRSQIIADAKREAETVVSVAAVSYTHLDVYKRQVRFGGN